MAETVLDQILDDLREQAVTHYPQRGDFKNLRVVGHTPKNDHFIYDACLDFADGGEVVCGEFVFVVGDSGLVRLGRGLGGRCRLALAVIGGVLRRLCAQRKADREGDHHRQKHRNDR